MVFKIGNLDISKYIVAGSYNVNSIDVEREWTDANFVVHKKKIRERIQGTFNMRFIKLSEYESFINFFKSLGNSNNYYSCIVASNNKNQSYTSNFFIEFTTVRDRKADGRNDFKEFTVKISEV